MKTRAANYYVIGQYAFLPVRAGVWIRTHWCTAFVGCPYRGCDAGLGEPCRDPKLGNDWCGTHYVRRGAVRLRHVVRRDGEFEYPPTLKIE